MRKIERRKFIAFTLMVLILAGTMSLWGQFARGEGTEGNPWQIETAEHLNNVRNYLGAAHSDKHFIQTANIDLYDATREGGEYWNDGEGWVPIGNNINRFTGRYDGNNLEIEGIYINRPETSLQGLFGYTESATIKNLGVTNVDITGRGGVGGLGGFSYETTISNCYSTGSVTGRNGNQVGGLMGGVSRESTISNCYSTGSVTAIGPNSNQVGGLVGNVGRESTISNSYSTGSVTGRNRVGGLVGSFSYESTISNSYSTGSVTGEREVGGLVGIASSKSIISNSYFTGNVTGNAEVGGLVGYYWYFATIRNSFYNYGQVLINDESVITTGALDSVMFTAWLENDLFLDIDDYLYYEGENYLINSVSDFKTLLAFGQFEEYSFRLSANLDLEDYPDLYIPYLSADFDGNGFSITNLTLDLGYHNHIGLFGITYGASIKNLGVNNVGISGNHGVGGLIGVAWEGSIISNCYSSGRVTGGVGVSCQESECSVGGLVGYAWMNTIISNSYSTGQNS